MARPYQTNQSDAPKETHSPIRSYVIKLNLQIILRPWPLLIKPTIMEGHSIVYKGQL